MIQEVDFLDTFIKTAAVSGIGLFWFNFTVKAFKMARHIISTSQEEETYKAFSKCEECHELFIDDGDENEKQICWTCLGN